MKRIGLFFLFQLACLSIVFTSCTQKQETRRYLDDFPRSTPELQGVISDGILNFIEDAQRKGMELNGFMFLRHGKVIAEGWWHPYRPTYNHIYHSLSKTFTSTAIGFAVQEGLLTVDDKVVSFFPDDLPENVSPYLSQLTVKHLLNMSAGHDEAPVFTINDPNWVRSFLATPIDHEPGTKFVYSSYATYMLSAIIHKLSGENVFDYLTPRLFDPLGITDIQWETDTRGISTGGWGMRAKTSDIARLGQFYLQKGKWNDQQLLSEAWINEATTAHIYQKPENTDEENAKDDWAQGYGYQIWVCTNDAYRGDGANGQLMVVLPDQDAVIAVNARLDDMQAELNLIWEHLLPAMKEGVLVSDEVTNDLLTSKLASLAIPDPFRTLDDLVIPKNETRQYQITDNKLMFSDVSFQFEANGDCLLSLTKDGVSHSFTFGYDTWRYGETDKTGPYYASPRRNPEGLAPFAIAGYGGWTKADELKLRLLYLTESRHEDYIFSFDGDNLSFTRSDDTQSDENTAVMKGQLVR